MASSGKLAPHGSRWLCTGSWGKDGREEPAVVGGKPQSLPPLFCWVGWTNLAPQWDSAWWHLVWWCLTRGSVVPSCVVPELLVLELVQTEANWGFWGGCLRCRAAGMSLSSAGIQDRWGRFLLSSLPVLPQGGSCCSWHRELSMLCCEHGLGLINTPGVQGPLFPLGRPRIAGRGWGKWHWRMLRDISHTGGWVVPMGM